MQGREERGVPTLYIYKLITESVAKDRVHSYIVDNSGITSSSAVAERPRDASCRSVVSSSSTIPRALSFCHAILCKRGLCRHAVCLCVCI